MINITDVSKCSGCHSCVAVCPKNCIDMIVDSEGFLYPKVNSSLCINCGLCEKACPIINSFDRNDNPSAFAAVNKNDKIRLRSSSGGIFTLLAENVLEKGGVVFGAAFADDFKEVVHIAVTDKEHLYKLRGSKYLQSKIGDTYKQAQDYLNKGVCVYFSGTPCQIAGLYSYLGKEYQNLYTQDLICHGVPSPLVWKRYLELREQGARSRASNVFFRQKNNSWKNYDLCIEFENGTKYEKCGSQDIFMRGFLSNLYLRPSCYVCGFKSVNRCADITLADFWGVQNILPKIDDDKGTSLVIVHSQKGMGLLKQIQSDIVIEETDLDLAVKHNPSMIYSSNLNYKREKFFKKKSNLSIDILINSCLRVSIFKRVFRKIKRYIKGK